MKIEPVSCATQRCKELKSLGVGSGFCKGGGFESISSEYALYFFVGFHILCFHAQLFPISLRSFDRYKIKL